MEFDEHITKLNGTLATFSSSNSDHEKLTALRAVFENVSERAKKRMLFYLVQNTEIPFVNIIDINSGLSACNNSIVNLDFPALCYIILNMNLSRYLEDVVKGCPAPFTIQLLNGIYAYADSRMKVRGIEVLIPAVFEKILKINRGIDDDVNSTYELWVFMNTFSSMIWSKTSFDGEDLIDEDVSKVLDTLLILVNLYNGQQPLSTDLIEEIKYFDYLAAKNESGTLRDPDLKTKFHGYIVRLLDLLRELLSTFFILNTRDRSMRENAFALYEILKGSEIEPENINLLMSIKQSPESEAEKISKADMSEIMARLLAGGATNNWYKALINFPGALLNEIALSCLCQCLDVSEYDDIIAILVSIQENFQKCSASIIMMNLYYSCFCKLKDSDKITFFNNYITHAKRPDLESIQCDDELTTMFNKLADPKMRDSSFMGQLLCFAIRSPVKTIKKLCEHTLYNAANIPTYIGDLKTLKAACLAKDLSSTEEPKLTILTSVLYKIIDQDYYLSKKRQIVVCLMMRLFNESLLDADIETALLDLIYREIHLKNYAKTEFILEIVKSLVKAKAVRTKYTIFLGFFSQLLDLASWTFTTFSSKFVKIREISVYVVNSLMKSHMFNPTAAELNWLRGKVMQIWEANQFYFCDLWYIQGQEFGPCNDLYAQLLILLYTNNKAKSASITSSITAAFQFEKFFSITKSFEAALIKILPHLIDREWPPLWVVVKSIVLDWIEHQEDKTKGDLISISFAIFSDVMFYLAQGSNRSYEAKQCFTYCLRNYGKLIRQTILPGIEMTNELAIDFLEKMVFLLNGIQDAHLRRENSILLSPVVLDIAGRTTMDNSEEKENFDKLQAWFRDKFIGRVTVKSKE